jgi:hypothetical protein
MAGKGTVVVTTMGAPPPLTARVTVLRVVTTRRTRLLRFGAALCA